MCFGNGNKDDPDAKKSKEIEKQLREDQKRMAKEVKLLLLGTYIAYLLLLDTHTDNAFQVLASRASQLS